MWLGFIPSDQVDALAAQIKAKQSKFYKGVPIAAAQDLAQRVNSGFPLRSVADPTVGSGSGSGSGPGTTGASAGDEAAQVRRDAIIGVVSSLGAIAIIVLVALVYHSMKRKKELAHRRLSDPPGGAVPSSGGAAGRVAEVGVRPDGREFDRDSVGGSRRRSFYFAEDSLRGFAAEQEREREREEAWRASTLASSSVSGGGAGPSAAAILTNRRTVIAPGAISAPILRESSMNW